MLRLTLPCALVVVVSMFGFTTPVNLALQEELPHTNEHAEITLASDGSEHLKVAQVEIREEDDLSIKRC